MRKYIIEYDNGVFVKQIGKANTYRECSIFIDNFLEERCRGKRRYGHYKKVCLVNGRLKVDVGNKSKLFYIRYFNGDKIKNINELV